MVGRYVRVGGDPVRTFPLWLSAVASIRSKRTDSTFERFQRDEIYRAECVGRVKHGGVQHTDTSVGGHYGCVREAATRGWAPTRPLPMFEYLSIYGANVSFIIQNDDGRSHDSMEILEILEKFVIDPPVVSSRRVLSLKLRFEFYEEKKIIRYATFILSIPIPPRKIRGRPRRRSNIESRINLVTPVNMTANRESERLAWKSRRALSRDIFISTTDLPECDNGNVIKLYFRLGST